MTERKETPVMEIKEIRSRKKEFLPLLLMGDEEERMIDRYLERGTLYAAEIGKETAAVCVVTEEEGFAEVKNLAVAPEWRRQGVGRALLEWAGASYRDRYTRLRLGTGGRLAGARFLPALRIPGDRQASGVLHKKLQPAYL